MVNYGLTPSSPSASSVAAAMGKAPEVFPPRWFRILMASIFSPRIAGAVPGVLPRLPPWLKNFLTLLVIVNAKNFPGVWHFRIFWSPALFRMRAVPAVHPLLPWFHSDKYVTRNPGAEPSLKLDYLPLGKDIFEHKTVHTFYSDFADIDFVGWHLSNSCYASRLDAVRAAHFRNSFILSHFDGCGAALGGTVFNFHREVPMFTKYAITCQFAAWDNKWLYIVSRWTDPPEKFDEETAEVLEQTKPKRSLSSVELRKFAASVLQSQREADAKEAASKKNAQEAGTDAKGKGRVEDKPKETPAKDKSDKILYATAVSRFCFKAGRKTIPPWFVIATSGFGTWASTRENFEKAEALRISTLETAKAEYRARTGAELPRDSVLKGAGFRAQGILNLYDPSRPEGAGPGDTRGLGVHQDKASWALHEWEERNVRALEALQGYGSVVAPPTQTLSAAAISALGTPTGMATPQTALGLT